MDAMMQALMNKYRSSSEERSPDQAPPPAEASGIENAIEGQIPEDVLMKMQIMEAMSEGSGASDHLGNQVAAKANSNLQSLRNLKK